MSHLMNVSNDLFINTYSRFPAIMVEGNGCKLKDTEGREYLDFVAGIAVCSLGHCHPVVNEAACRQMNTLIHVSNLYHTMPQMELAGMLVDHSFADKVFMANSGAEANEAAIKLARKHAGDTCYEIITLEGSFHGRTLATVAATGQKKFHKGFEPLPAGFVHAPFNDLKALEKLISNRTCAIMVEPLQGEGGCRPLDLEYMQGLRSLCDQHSILLIFDEVQVAMGRTGTLFAYEQYRIRPDILTTAKALGNGLPIGAMLTTNKVAASFQPGDHASTFGGNPVACAAATAVMKTLISPGFLDKVRESGAYLHKTLRSVTDQYSRLAYGVQGRGLIQGIVLSDVAIPHAMDIVNRLFEMGILVNLAGNGTVIRCTPPLTVTPGEIDALSATLEEVFSSM